jgi:hypothetical protein
VGGGSRPLVATMPHHAEILLTASSSKRHCLHSPIGCSSSCHLHFLDAVWLSATMDSQYILGRLEPQFEHSPCMQPLPACMACIWFTEHCGKQCINV